MDLKTRILRWEREIDENHAVAVLAIIIGIAAIFLIILFVDALFKRRRDRKRQRRK
jgi:uncharacterized membrane protein YuzA (DUF378 family)